MSSPIKTVIVIGASGSVGRTAVTALLAAGFQVSALTRDTSDAKFPPSVTVQKTDYTLPYLLQAFEGQNAIVSAIATASTPQQTTIIDAAITSGVKRFFPSEFGVDTANPKAGDVIPALAAKLETIRYLRTKESSGLSWTAIVVGSIFDWTFEHPGLMGWNLPERKATLFDGGSYGYEATNLGQIGLTIAAVLKPENLEATKNEFVYVNSFTVTQNQVLGGFEKLLGKFEVRKGNAVELGKEGLAGIQRGDGTGAHVNTIVAAVYGNGGLNHYSKTRELWNERLALPAEKLEDALERIVGGVEGGK